MDEVVVLGYKGMLGSYVCSFLKERDWRVRGIGSEDGPIVNHNLGAAIVINCAGAIPQRYTDADRDKYYQLNIALPRLLQTQASRVVHISTDCVFSGKRGLYSEDDVPDPNSLYGSSKYLGEPVGANCYTIRTSIIGDNTDHGLLRWYVDNKWPSINGFKNHLWNGVTCLQLAKEIERLISHGGPPLYHYHSPDVISKFTLLESIKKVYGGPMVCPTNADTIVNRSLRSIYGFTTPTIIEQLEEMYAYEIVS